MRQRTSRPSDRVSDSPQGLRRRPQRGGVRGGPAAVVGADLGIGQPGVQARGGNVGHAAFYPVGARRRR